MSRWVAERSARNEKAKPRPAEVRKAWRWRTGKADWRRAVVVVGCGRCGGGGGGGGALWDMAEA